MKTQIQAIDILVNLTDWLMNNSRESLAPAFEALKIDAETVFSAFDHAYGEEEDDDNGGHLVPLARVGQELRSMGVEFDD